MMGRRVRRSGGVRQTVLPLRSRRLANTISCWYCDLKIVRFNEPLFSFGRKYVRWQKWVRSITRGRYLWILYNHTRFLRVWFTIGVGLSIMALLGVLMVLLWEVARILHLHTGKCVTAWFFDISTLVRNFRISLADTGVVVLSTFISVGFHEFGHAIAAACAGIRIEYLAIFLAVLFPGALVAFNCDLLQSLPRFTELQIYCAGIWHNAVLAVVCGLTLFLLPSILSPIYIHNDGALVLDIAPTSPLTAYLSPGDVITSIDGSNFSSPSIWVALLSQTNAATHHGSYYSVNPSMVGWKGYCVPNSAIERSNEAVAVGDQFSCLDNEAAFLKVPCSSISFFSENNSRLHSYGDSEKYCLTAQDVVKLKKCSSGWRKHGKTTFECACSEEETCMGPVPIPGMSWIEISYFSPYSSDCLKPQQRSPLVDYFSNNSQPSLCGGTFIFVGSALSIVDSVQLSAYRPRRALLMFTAYLPMLMEKMLSCTSQMSACLAVLNSLPVFCLDGESILETILSYIRCLSSRMRRKFLLFFLIIGTLLSLLVLSKLIYLIFAGSHF